MKQKLGAFLAISFCILCIIPFTQSKAPQGTTDPDTDFWRWKNQNNRETGNFTYWFMPLGLYPRSLLLNVRFGLPVDANQESRDDAIDSTPAFTFWLQWIFLPWWPIKNIAVSHFRDAHTYLDDVFVMLSWTGIVIDSIVSLMFFLRAIKLLLSQDKDWQTHLLRLCLFSFLFIFPALTLLGFAFASFNFYILYRITPLFISRLLFHCYIYFGIPLSMFLYTYFSLSLITGDSVVKTKSN